MDSKKNSILIVDDESSNIMILTQILSRDYTIYAAKSGRDAIEIANEYKPDVILMDILMPEMDGYAVIAELKGSFRTHAIPVIFVSGLNEVWDEEKGLSAGASDYISKPFSTAIVRLRVQNQIRMQNYIRTIEHLGMMDQLTDIPNRRSFDERLRLEWARAVRDKTPISLLMIDLDRFKDYNDTYGHMQGDKALQEVAKLFTHELKRSVDFVARWGGEEFVVLLGNTTGYGAAILAERIRAKVEQLPILLADGKATFITVSIGVYTQIPTPGNPLDDFIRNGDSAMYEAKKSGRNKVFQYVKQNNI